MLMWAYHYIAQSAMLKLGAKFFCYVSSLRLCPPITRLICVIFESLKLTLAGIETISTGAEQKEHLIFGSFGHFRFALQIITATGRSSDQCLRVCNRFILYLIRKILEKSAKF